MGFSSFWPTVRAVDENIRQKSYKNTSNDWKFTLFNTDISPIYFKNLTNQRTEGSVENWFTVNSKSLFQPLLEPLEHNLNQNSPIKGLFQPTLEIISTRGCKVAVGSWTVLALIIREPNWIPTKKNRTVFDSPKRDKHNYVLLFLFYLLRATRGTRNPNPQTLSVFFIIFILFIAGSSCRPQS